MDYYNISYPIVVGDGYPEWLYRLWQRVMCKRGYHLFDEVAHSCDDDLLSHYLYCDACAMEVHIEKIVI